MRIDTTVTLDDPDESFAYTPDAGAAQVLAALGGNATKDTSHLTVIQRATGSAGTPPEPLTAPS
jgi:hypothetical protein